MNDRCSILISLLHQSVENNYTRYYSPYKLIIVLTMPSEKPPAGSRLPLTSETQCARGYGHLSLVR